MPRLTRVGIAILRLLASAGAACTATYAPKLVPDHVSRVTFIPPPDLRGEPQGFRPRRSFAVNVHDFADGCPLVESTRRGKGFRGKIEAPMETATTVEVPSGRRLTFTTVWLLGPPRPLVAVGPAWWCTSVVTFVPEAGGTYSIRYAAEPNPGQRACGATAEKSGAARSHGGPVPELIAYPHALIGAPAFEPGGLCTLSPD